MSLNIFLIEAQTKYLWHGNVSCQIKCHSLGSLLRSKQPQHQELSKNTTGVASRRGPAGRYTNQYHILPYLLSFYAHSSQKL